MDFGFYRNFITIAEAGSLTAAARKLAVAQPALTAQAKTLEQYYGAKLIRTSRRKRALELTEAGEVFFAKAKQICNAKDNLALDMLNFSKKAESTLRFGVSPAKCDFFISRYLLPFIALCPNVSYQFHSEIVELQTVHISSGSLDFAFANAPLPVPQLYSLCRRRLEYFYAVYARKSSPVRNAADPLPLAELSELPVCCTYGNYPLLRKVCAKYGFTPKIRFITNTFAAALDFARRDGSVAILNLMPEEEVEGCVKLRLDNGDLRFEQTLYWLATEKLSPVARPFLEFCRERNEEDVEA